MSKNFKKIIFAFIVVAIVFGIVVIARTGKFEKLQGYMYSWAAQVASDSDVASPCDVASSSDYVAPSQTTTQRPTATPKTTPTPTPTPTLTATPTPTPTPEPEVKDLSLKSSELTASTVSQIVAATGNVEVTLDTKATITRGVFEALKGTDRNLTIKAGENEIVFKGNDIKNSKDIEADMSYEVISEDKDLQDKGLENGIVVYFADNGKLPGVATVRLKVDSTIRKTLNLDNIYVYFYDEENDDLEELSDEAEYTNGYIEFEIEHNSKYVLVSEEIEEKEAETEETKKESKNEKEDDDDEVTFLESNKMYLIIIGAAILVVIIVVVIIIVNKKKKKKAKEKAE